jgi:hypothetical protein
MPSDGAGPGMSGGDVRPSKAEDGAPDGSGRLPAGGCVFPCGGEDGGPVESAIALRLDAALALIFCTAAALLSSMV